MDQLRMVTKNNNQANEKFLSREPIVLLPILGLMVLKGVGSTVEQERFLSHVEEGQLSNAFRDHYALQTFASVLGIMLVPFLSDIHGRKPVFILLFTLALLSSILNYVPYQNPWPTIGNCIVNTLRGGVLTITALAICEYCSPEHRFAWLVASEFMKMFSASVTSILYAQNGLSKVSSYGSSVVVLVAVVCLVCLYWWPESPYWLASQGRKEESKAALLWLRREGPAARAELTALETARRRRPSPKLFWLSLLISILAVTVAMCAASEKLILTIVNHKLETVKLDLTHRIKIVCADVLISVIFVVISYEVKRKALCLTASIIPLVLVYILSIWLWAKQDENYKEAFYITTLICNSLLEFPFHLNFTIFIEVVPQKYYTYMSCISSLFFHGTSIIFPALNLAYDDSFPLYGSLLLFATLSLGASGVVYGLSQETADTNLLEIEKKYLTRLYRNHNHEQIQVVELEEDSRL